MTRVRPRVIITKRDELILAAIASYRFMSRRQLAALFFPSIDAARVRLRLLRSAGTILNYGRSIRGVRTHRDTETVYALAHRGAKVLEQRQPSQRVPYLQPSDTRSHFFVAHTLRRGDVRAALELLDDQAKLRLAYWRQTPTEVRLTARVSGGRRDDFVEVIPDGVFATVHGSVAQVIIVEVDLGTVALEKMRRRYCAYIALSRTGELRRRFGGTSARVLTLCRSRGRLRSLLGVAGGSRLVAGALLSHVDPMRPSGLLDLTVEVADGTTERLFNATRL